MKVMKFGGTSVGSASRMKNVANLIEDGQQNFVVLSAMSGTTNSLIEISDYYQKGNAESASAVVNILRNKYIKHVDELFTDEKKKKEILDFLFSVFQELVSFSTEGFGEHQVKEIVSKGEIMSTHMMAAFLEQQGASVKLLDSLDFMKIDENSIPDTAFLKTQLKPILEANKDTKIF